MEYGNNMMINPNMYMGMNNGYMNQIPVYQKMPSNDGIFGDIITVNGREGAERLALKPNSRILLLDTTKPIVWLKQTDGAGYGTVEGYTITPLKETEKVEINSALETRLVNIETRLGALYEQWESNFGGVKATATK